jgi:arylsulfatase A-like enzyme/Flp pilus assembly protein TadD
VAGARTGWRPGRAAAGAALGLLGAAAIAFWHFRGSAPVRAPGSDVLLISIDTLRADALGAYGNPAARTPVLDRLAAGGVRFDFAHAHNVVTLPSHANILSGRHPYDHRVRENSGFRFPADLETMATLLKAQGYRTGAFVSAFPLDSRFGLDRGFDVYDDRLGNFEEKADFHMQERAGAETVAAALAWLRGGSGPTFCFVHLYEPHAPYEPPAEIARGLARPYDGEVAAADAALAPLLEPLLAQGREGRTLVVMTADHGESLGEHGEATHGIFAYEATLRVPLVLHHARLFRPRVVEAPARHVDLLPTVLDALGLRAPQDLPGRSLLGVAQGGDAAAGTSLTYFESATPALTRGWAPVFGILRDRTKHVDLPIPELYDLAADPREQSNLAAREPELMARLREALGRERARDRGVERGSESAETLERLRSLGYAAAGSAMKASYTEADDPKRNIAFEADLQEVLGRHGSGDLAGALVRAEALVARYPRVGIGWRDLSFLRRQSGDLKGAVDAGRRAVELDPTSVDALSQLGNYLNESRRFGETVALLGPLAEDEGADLDVRTAYAAALAESGRRDDALRVLEAARRTDPSSALVLLNIGTVHLLFGERKEAREALEGAIAREPRMARAYNSLGVVAAQEGDATRAADLWRQSLAINPGDLDTLFNLGKLLWRSGRRAEARTYLDAFVELAPSALYGKDVVAVKRLLQDP